MPALAITDHGNLFGAIDFYIKCKEYGIKPIIGIEAYVAPESRLIKESKKGDLTAGHLTLLAKNTTGYRNLIKLATLAYTEGFYYKPRIDLELLSKYHDGIICLSGCINSIIWRTMLNAEEEERGKVMFKWIDVLKSTFKDNFYIELQYTGLKEQESLINILKDSVISSRINTKYVATNDIHYTNKEDADAHDALLCIGTGTTIDNKDRMRFDTQEYYIKSENEMLKIFDREYINNTYEIDDKINLEIPLHSNKPIIFSDRHNSIDTIKEKCDDKIKGMSDSYRRRYEQELEAVQKTNYGDYLLFVADFVDFAKGHNIPIGGGRGSSAGSLICYLLGITEIDPLHYGLLFERFINTERVEPPDIDIDVCQSRRGELIDYIKNKYGTDKVAQIITFGTLKSKAAIKDACRVLSIPFWISGLICKQIPEPFEGNINDVFSMHRVLDVIDNNIEDSNLRNRLMTIAQKIEGRMRHSSTHAAGIVISDTKLIDVMPLCTHTSSDELLTQYDMYAIENLGLLKFDILGLKCITVINEVCKYANIEHNAISLDDQYIYQMLGKGETIGVFQYEGQGYTKFIKRMQPQVFNDLIALGALYRPGPLNSGMADEYLNRMHGEPYEDIHPKLTNILNETYGTILYQEQIMQIAVTMAGFTMNEADIMRKAIGKKDEELMQSTIRKFRIGMLKNKYGEDLTNDIINRITTFARYGWNKAHAVSYALLSYKTAYLKYKHSTEYFCALLNSETDTKDRIDILIKEAQRYGVAIKSPHINLSSATFTIHDKKIYSGLLSVRGIGNRACDIILSERATNGTFTDTEQFRKRIPPKKINISMLKELVNADCFREIINNELHINIESATNLDVIQIHSICSEYPGVSQVYLHTPLHTFVTDMKVDVNDELLGRITRFGTAIIKQ